MNPVRLVVLGVALIAAIGLAVLLRDMTAPKTPKGPTTAFAPTPQSPSARVLVASRDLEVGDKLDPSSMTWQAWPAEALNASFIVEGAPVPPAANGAARLINTASESAQEAIGGNPAMQALVGDIVRQPVPKGEPILRINVVRPGQGGYMSVMLDPGTRAVAVPVNPGTGAGGFIEPGDRIDLLESGASGADKSGPTTETVLSDAKVLAVDQATTEGKNGRSILGSTVTLEVPQNLVEMVVEAKARGGLTLVLRSIADAGGAASVGGSGASQAIRLFAGGPPTMVMAPQ
ncbi:MAG: Flp pilus assembly protein CpaB [Caulobacteraceae bacterium]